MSQSCDRAMLIFCSTLTFRRQLDGACRSTEPSVLSALRRLYRIPATWYSSCIRPGSKTTRQPCHRSRRPWRTGILRRRRANVACSGVATYGSPEHNAPGASFPLTGLRNILTIFCYPQPFHFPLICSISQCSCYLWITGARVPRDAFPSNGCTQAINKQYSFFSFPLISSIFPILTLSQLPFFCSVPLVWGTYFCRASTARQLSVRTLKPFYVLHLCWLILRRQLITMFSCG